MHASAQPVESPGVFSSSPTSLTHPSFEGVDREDPFEIRPPPPLRHRITADGSDLHIFSHPSRSSSDPQQPLTRSRTRESMDSTSAVEDKNVWSHKRWFSSPRGDPKEKRGLNPEAKVFQLKSPFPALMFNKQRQNTSVSSLDLVPSQVSIPSQAHTHLHILPSSISAPSMLPLPTSTVLASSVPLSSTNSSIPDSIFSTLSMRAFAPSPAEREALTRSLGGSSTNTSLERLPTLSEVSIPSIPNSPQHVHAMAQAVQRSPPGSVAEVRSNVGSGGMPHGFAWLHLPRARKPKFSPWEDEVVPGGETSTTATSNANGAASMNGMGLSNDHGDMANY